MATNGQSKQAEKALLLHGRLRFVLLFVFSFLLCLALISHAPSDSAYMAGGIGGKVMIQNWIGYLGAFLSRLLLILIGFAAYPLAGLLLFTSARRFLGRGGLRPAAWDYWVAIGLTTLGFCMLCGIWPDMLPTLAGHLNISQTPGGVLGQRLCAPKTGWFRLILNPVGSAIVASGVLTAGLAVIWVYDWHDRFKIWYADWKAAKARQAEADLQTPPPRSAEEVLRPTRKPAAERPTPVPEAPLLEPEPENKVKDKPAPPATAPAPAKPRAARSSGKKTSGTYRLPSMDMLNPDREQAATVDIKEIEHKKEILQATLDSFGIEASVGNATSGPRVTLFEVLPAPGVKVERISQISNNIAMELRAISLRILTPIPGRNSVGIEVPNINPASVSFHSLLNTPAWKKGRNAIPLVLGRDISGGTAILDLAKAPHLLIAGATGSGKSVCINALIMSLLYRFSPEELRMIMVDPKVVEFRAFNTLPHLVVPVISDVKKVPLALRWVIREMENRYQILAKVGARNLEGFNSRPKSKEEVLDDDGNPIPDKLPFIVVIIDELADIMMTAKADVETSLARIAQLSRAVGIHTVLATQRPSVNVITGTIKANFPTRIAFQVTSQVDSRTILDGKGAESLLGRGDMLFRPPGAAGLERNQGAMVGDDEIERVVEHCSAQAEQDFDMSVFLGGDEGGGEAGGVGGEALSDADEEIIQQAIEVIVRDRRATTSYVQRCLRIGYNRAALVMEILEQRGVIGPQVGTMPREILMSSDGRHNPADEEELEPDIENWQVPSAADFSD